MAYKVFTNGSVLNASELNEFLMNQSVITFSNSTARGSAITTPVEGMITYLEDTQTYESWDGAAWVAFGGGGAGTGNAIINGGFDFWQRGTSLSAANYLADRFIFNGGGAGSVVQSRQTFTPGTAPIAGYEAEYFWRGVISTAYADSNLTQKIEDVRTFAGQTATLSFFAKADASKTLTPILVQNFGTGGSADVVNIGSAVSLTTSWQRFSISFSVASVSGKTIGANSRLEVALSTGAQTGTFDIWGVQLEAGSTATDFRRNANSLQGELAACQRYFQIMRGNGRRPGFNYNTNLAQVTFPFLVTMRDVPTVFTTSATISEFGVYHGTSNTALNALPLIWEADNQSATFGFQVASGLTAGQGVAGRIAINAFIGIQAEL